MKLRLFSLLFWWISGPLLAQVDSAYLPMLHFPQEDGVELQGFNKEMLQSILESKEYGSENVNFTSDVYSGLKAVTVHTINGSTYQGKLLAVNNNGVYIYNRGDQKLKFYGFTAIDRIYNRARFPNGIHAVAIGLSILMTLPAMNESFVLLLFPVAAVMSYAVLISTVYITRLMVDPMSNANFRIKGKLNRGAQYVQWVRNNADKFTPRVFWETIPDAKPISPRSPIPSVED